MSEPKNHRLQAANRRTGAASRRRGRFLGRPSSAALWAFALAVLVMVAAAATAQAGSGGTGLGGGGTGGGGSGGTGGGSGSSGAGRYANMWTSFKSRDHHWAHRTSKCESGGDPTAIGGGGRYRGAFQFTRQTWNHSPKSPGGDPINYTWKTQAVVAVLLKHKVGTSPWPVCGKPKSPRAKARTARIERRGL